MLRINQYIYTAELVEVSGGEIFHLHFWYIRVSQIVSVCFLVKSGGGGENHKKIMWDSLFLFEVNPIMN